MISFVIWQSPSSSVEAKVLIELVLASSGVIASSPNRSLNGVNPVDLETTVISSHLLMIPAADNMLYHKFPVKSPENLVA